MNAPQHSDSREGSPHGYPRNRGDITPLLMLPAPIAVSSIAGTPSGSSSLTDAPYVRPADSPLAMSSSPSDVPGDSEREDSVTSGRTMVNMGPHAVIRPAPGQTLYPGETPNPYRHSQPQMAATYDQGQVASYGYTLEPTMDEYPQQQYTSSPSQLPQYLPSPSQQPQQLPDPDRTRRRFSLVDPGPVSSPDTQVRRVAVNRQSKRHSGSHASPRYNQRNSGLFTSSPSSPQNDFYMPSPSPQPSFLPPGAAPPQGRGYHGPQ